MTAIQAAIEDMRNSGEWTGILWQDSNLKSSVEYPLKDVYSTPHRYF